MENENNAPEYRPGRSELRTAIVSLAVALVLTLVSVDTRSDAAGFLAVLAGILGLVSLVRGLWLRV